MVRPARRGGFRRSAAAAVQSFCEPRGAHAGARPAGDRRERGLVAGTDSAFRRRPVGTLRACARQMGGAARPEKPLVFPSESRFGRPARRSSTDSDALRGDADGRRDGSVLFLRERDEERPDSGRTRPDPGLVRSGGSLQRPRRTHVFHLGFLPQDSPQNGDAGARRHGRRFPHHGRAFAGDSRPDRFRGVFRLGGRDPHRLRPHPRRGRNLLERTPEQAESVLELRGGAGAVRARTMHRRAVPRGLDRRPRPAGNAEHPPHHAGIRPRGRPDEPDGGQGQPRGPVRTAVPRSELLPHRLRSARARDAPNPSSRC